MEKLTKEQITELGHNAQLADALGLEYVETTTGTNGYPRNLKHAIVSGSIRELNELSDYLESLGFEVDKLELHRRDGWGLWERSSIPFFEEGVYLIADEQDFTFDYDPDWTEEEAKDELCEFICGDSPVDNHAKLVMWLNKIDAYYEEMSSYDEPTTFFLDGVNDMSIMYGISKDNAGYSYDTHHKQLAIHVNFNQEN